MSCDEYRDGILDLARDVASAEDAVRVRAHVEACAACATWIDEQRALTTGLRALAAATAADRPSEALESRVLAAFAEYQAPGAGMGEVGRPSLPQWGGRPCPPGQDTQAHATVTPASNRGSWRMWMRVAAVLALAVGAFAWWRFGDTTGGRTAAGPATPVKVSRQAQAPVRAGRSAAATAPVPTAEPALTSSLTAPAPPASARVPARRQGARHSSPPPVVVATGFTPLASAATLPAFERGEILRVEIPVTSLPVYGIAIPPDAVGLVQADLLVGQDGQVRAARLVTNDLIQDSRNKR